MMPCIVGFFLEFQSAIHTMQMPFRPLTRVLATAGLITFLATSVQAQGVRPEVGKPLQQASELLKAGKAKDALAKVKEAEAVGGLTAAEQNTVNRMKASAAQRAGDLPAAISALEALYPKVSGTEQNQVAEQLASAHAQAKNNATAADWLKKAEQGGYTSPTLKQLQSYLQSASGDYSAIAKSAAAAVSGAEEAGRKPEEADLLRLADAYQRTGNAAGNISTLEKLLQHYPKKDYWAAYLGRLPRKPGFSDRFGVDVGRLKLANNLFTKGEDYFELAQLALQADQPAEAAAIMKKGFDAKLLGVGADGDRHKRLAELAQKKVQEGAKSLLASLPEAEAAKDGNQLAKIGMAVIGVGQSDQGIPLLEKALAKGGLKRPEDVKLRLGLAQLKAGNRAKATQTLRGVGGNEGAADIARLALMAPAN